MKKVILIKQNDIWRERDNQFPYLCSEFVRSLYPDIKSERVQLLRGNEPPANWPHVRPVAEMPPTGLLVYRSDRDKPTRYNLFDSMSAWLHQNQHYKYFWIEEV